MSRNWLAERDIEDVEERELVQRSTRGVSARSPEVDGPHHYPVFIPEDQLGPRIMPLEAGPNFRIFVWTDFRVLSGF